MGKKSKVQQDSAERINRSKLDTNALTIKIKSNDTGEILTEENGASILFASVIGSDKGNTQIKAGMAGEFSQESILQSFEAVTDATIHGLKQTDDSFDAEDFIQLMSGITSEALDRNFNDKEKLSALLMALAKAVKN